MKKMIYQRGKSDKAFDYKPICNHDIMSKYKDTIINLREVIIFIWLKDGSSFWYYVKSSSNNKLEGYIKGKNGWTNKSIYVKDVVSYY